MILRPSTQSFIHIIHILPTNCLNKTSLSDYGIVSRTKKGVKNNYLYGFIYLESFRKILFKTFSSFFFLSQKKRFKNQYFLLVPGMTVMPQIFERVLIISMRSKSSSKQRRFRSEATKLNRTVFAWPMINEPM